jgi:hypothetical protein
MGLTCPLATMFLSAVVALSLCLIGQAQSGRRLPSRTNPPPPPAKEEPPAQISQEPQRALIPMLLASGTSTVNTSTFYANIVIEHCAQRLKEALAFDVSVAPSEINRKEASDRAKNEAKSYVLWIELEVDYRVGEDPVNVGVVEPDRLVVNYTVFTPGTGKVKTSGRVYQRPRTVMSTPIPTPTPHPGTGVDLRHNLDGAGRETAERVMNALEVVQLPPKD